MIKVFILTIFPNLVKNFFKLSIIKRAINKKKVEIEIVNIRKFSNDKHKKVDDYVYGIKKGMLFKFEPLYKAIEYSKSKCNNPYVILPSPKGKVLNNYIINDLSKLKELIFIAPNYEGVDQRILRFINEELSIGDYVISSGELAVFVILEAILRKLTINTQSLLDDSFSLFNNPFLIEYPQYTRPNKIPHPLNDNILTLDVPEILIKGNHKQIIKNNLKESIAETICKKPILFLSIFKYLKIKKIKKKMHYLNKFFAFLNTKELDDILFEATYDNIIPT